MRKKRTAALLLAPFLLLTALVAGSCVYVLLQSLGRVPAFGLRELTLDYYRQVLAAPELAAALKVSLLTAGRTALGASLLGTALCAALVRCRSRWALYLVRLPILVPHTVVALCAVLLLGQTGLLARLAFAAGLIPDSASFPQLLYTPAYTGVDLAYLWKEAPFVAYFALALMASVSGTLGQAAENLGASPLRSFFTVDLPLTLPAISKAFLIIFLFAFGGYELPLLLGATLPKALPVFAHLQYQAPDLRTRPYAMAVFGLLLLLSLAVTLVYGALTGRLLKKLRGEA